MTTLFHRSHQRPAVPTATTSLCLGLAALLTACQSDDGGGTVGPPSMPPPPALITVLDRAEALGATRFVEVANLSTFLGTLEGLQDVTVLVPTNAAMDSLPPATLTTLLSAQGGAERDAFIGQLTAAGAIDQAALNGLGSLVTLGGTLVVDSIGGGTLINDAILIASDEDADNGIVHLLDRALLPPAGVLETLTARGLDRLVIAIEAAGLGPELEAGTLTLLAPNQAALDTLTQAEFDDLIAPANAAELAMRLRFHILPGITRAGEIAAADFFTTTGGPLIFAGQDSQTRPTLNGSSAETFNTATTGGLIHEIDAFLEVPPTFEEAATAANLQAFDTLIFAGTLGAEFDMTAPLTVFGPTDTAFTNLPVGVFDLLVDPINVATLRTVVRSHAVPFALTEASLMQGGSFTTLSGSLLEVTIESNGDVLIDGTARLETTDTFFRNGILHTIDAVLAVSGL